MTDASSPDLLPMRDVVSLTGINPVTLRAWERRHGLISPQRTEGGHRLYTATDVQRIRDILRWTGGGVPISKVGGLLGGQPQAPSGEADAWRGALAQAAQGFDGQALATLYAQLFSQLPPARVLREVFLPVWHELAGAEGFGQRSQWLYLDRFLRTQLLLRLHSASPAAPRVLLAAAEGLGEVPLLCAALMLSSPRQRIEVLGCGQPLEELPLLCVATQPAALVIALDGPVTPPLARRLRALQMDIDCPLALVGAGLAGAQAVLQGIPLRLLDAGDEQVAEVLEALVRGRLEL